MGNNYFRFKQFTVHQDKCAMKVTTDSCLFGAWVADAVLRLQMPVNTILDIGTGTGLLSLMLAQKVNAHITAVEIDTDAANQASQNFQHAPWKNQLLVFNNSIQNFSMNATNNNRFDLIISNPPFYLNDLKSPDVKTNIAHHSAALKWMELIEIITRLLSPCGYFAVLLPFNTSDNFEALATQNKLFPVEMFCVRQKPASSFFRKMIIFSKNKGLLVTGEIIITNKANQYDTLFVQLLKDYYLHV